MRPALSPNESLMSNNLEMPCFSLDLFIVSIIIRPYSKSAKEQGNV